MATSLRIDASTHYRNHRYFNCPDIYCKREYCKDHRRLFRTCEVTNDDAPCCHEADQERSGKWYAAQRAEWHAQLERSIDADIDHAEHGT